MLGQHQFLLKKEAEIISLWKMAVMLSHLNYTKTVNYPKKSNNGQKIETGNTILHQSKKYDHISCATVLI